MHSVKNLTPVTIIFQIYTNPDNPLEENLLLNILFLISFVCFVIFIKKIISTNKCINLDHVIVIL